MECFHRQLKVALKANSHPEHWTDAQPLILLGIQTAIKEDVFCTAAELVYGTSLSLPGEFFATSGDNSTDPGSYVAQLKSTMHDAVRKHLQQTYDGPFRGQRSSTPSTSMAAQTVSIDKHKPAHLDSHTLSVNSHTLPSILPLPLHPIVSSPHQTCHTDNPFGTACTLAQESDRFCSLKPRPT